MFDADNYILASEYIQIEDGMMCWSVVPGIPRPVKLTAKTLPNGKVYVYSKSDDSW